PDQLVDLTVERGGVELARRVLAERRERADLEPLLAGALDLAVQRAQAPDLARAKITVEVAPPRRGDGLAAVDVAARDGAAVAGVPVRDDREDQPPDAVRSLARLVARTALPDAPPVVVQGALLLGRAHVDLFPFVL